MVTKRNQKQPRETKHTRRRQRRRMVALEPDKDARLEALADLRGTNVNCQIQMAVSKFLDEAEAEIDPLRAKGAEAIGLCSSGK